MLEAAGVGVGETAEPVEGVTGAAGTAGDAAVAFVASTTVKVVVLLVRNEASAEADVVVLPIATTVSSEELVVVEVGIKELALTRDVVTVVLAVDGPGEIVGLQSVMIPRRQWSGLATHDKLPSRPYLLGGCHLSQVKGHRLAQWK